MFRGKPGFVKSKARRSPVGEYECKYDWYDIFVQCGGSDNYRYFFEAFPNEKHVNTFIRGEGKTLEEAEESAWKKFLHYESCHLEHYNHENFEAKGYTNGLGFCKNCGMSRSEIIPPTEICCNCGQKTHYSHDNKNQPWCRHCAKTQPEELWTDSKRMLQRTIKEEEEEGPLTPEEFEKGLTEVITHLAKINK